MSKLAFRAQTVDTAYLPLRQDLFAKNVLMTAQKNSRLGNSLRRPESVCCVSKEVCFGRIAFLRETTRGLKFLPLAGVLDLDRFEIIGDRVGKAFGNSPSDPLKHHSTH